MNTKDDYYQYKIKNSTVRYVLKMIIKKSPDINLVKSILDWSQIIDLEKGFQKTINYFTPN